MASSDEVKAALLALIPDPSPPIPSADAPVVELADLPWRVTVRRLGPYDKGKRFYFSYATREEADQVAAVQNESALRRAQEALQIHPPQDLRYFYEVESNEGEVQ